MKSSGSKPLPQLARFLNPSFGRVVRGKDFFTFSIPSPDGMLERWAYCHVSNSHLVYDHGLFFRFSPLRSGCAIEDRGEEKAILEICVVANDSRHSSEVSRTLTRRRQALACCMSHAGIILLFLGDPFASSTVALSSRVSVSQNYRSFHGTTSTLRRPS
jgi:hypothetical protein